MGRNAPGPANVPNWLRLLIALGVLAAGGWKAFDSAAAGDSGGQRRKPPKTEERTDRGTPAETDDEDEGSLQAEERAGGHLIRKHVGQTPEQLQARLSRERNLNAVSTFPDLATAEAAVKEAQRAQRGRIDRWLRGEGGDRLVLTHRMDRVIGVTLRRGDREPRPARAVRLVLVKDRRESDGYRILTGYPQ
ncbi:MAG: hypothetical protein JSR82_23495 [Verrucomicrobia bacterium]|nr:hypothetical protein [Verrucomicrobiota bacterium]